MFKNITKLEVEKEDLLVEKLLNSSKKLQLQMIKSSNQLYDLWSEENEKIPDIVYTFPYALCWSKEDYKMFCEQIKKWAEHKNVDPVKEMKYRTKVLLIRNKQLVQKTILMIWFEKFSDSPRWLQEHYKKIQQFLKNIENEDTDLLIAEPIEEKYPEFGRLNNIIIGMNAYASHIADFSEKSDQLIIMSAGEQASYLVNTELKEEK